MSRYDAMAVREYQDKTGVTRSAWTKIGAAFVNKDGSIGIQLDCFPIDGKIILQVPLSREEIEAKRAAYGNGGNQNRQGGQGGGYQQNRGYQGNRSRRGDAPVQQNFGPGPGVQPAYQAEEHDAQEPSDEPPFR